MPTVTAEQSNVLAPMKFRDKKEFRQVKVLNRDPTRQHPDADCRQAGQQTDPIPASPLEPRIMSPAIIPIIAGVSRGMPMVTPMSMKISHQVKPKAGGVIAPIERSR